MDGTSNVPFASFFSSFLFQQGVGMCLGEVYYSTLARRQLIGAGEAGIAWALRRVPEVLKIDFYILSPSDQEKVRERERERECVCV